MRWTISTGYPFNTFKISNSSSRIGIFCFVFLSFFQQHALFKHVSPLFLIELFHLELYEH